MGNRHFTRIQYESEAVVMIGGRAFSAVTGNLSLNGMYLRMEHSFPVGKRAEVTFHLPSASRGSTITVNGTIVRNDFHGFAIHFRALDEESFIHLKSVINRKATHRLKTQYIV